MNRFKHVEHILQGEIASLRPCARRTEYEDALKLLEAAGKVDKEGMMIWLNHARTGVEYLTIDEEKKIFDKAHNPYAEIRALLSALPSAKEADHD